MNKMIINLCPTGMVPTKQMNPNVPITPEEIIKDALDTAKLGVSMVHIHARDKSGAPTWKKDVFAKIIYGIREKNEQLILIATTSGRNWSDFERRSEVLELEGDLKPDMASLTVGSMNFIRTASTNSPQMIEMLANKMMERGIKPELEVFEPGMVYKANYLIKKGIIKDDHPYYNILLGSLGTSPLNPSVFGSIHALIPTNGIWSVAGIGRYQLNANIMSMTYGGSIRVGLEDNIFYDFGEKNTLATNLSLVERIVKIAKTMSIEIATPQEAREQLGL